MLRQDEVTLTHAVVGKDLPVDGLQAAQPKAIQGLGGGRF